MSDILTDARKWLETPGRLENIGTHGEECHRWHLACLVSRLTDEIARLREERRWVSVGERLPDLNEANRHRVNCLVWCKSGGVCEMTYEINTYAKQERNRQPRWKWQGLIDRSEVTHWQPLPPGPEGNG